MSAHALHAGRPEQPESERLAWAQFQVAAMVHDDARSVQTWRARQDAYSAWVAKFLHDEGMTA